MNIKCDCAHEEIRHWFYRENCLDCECSSFYADEGELINP